MTDLSRGIERSFILGAGLGMDELAELLGESPTMQMVRERLHRLLDRQRAGQRLPPILLQGETGTGKGLVARALHRYGSRSRARFMDVNCAAIPETLLEAELFGFEQGAFTDARSAKPGLLQAAHGGVLFLDEIGLLSEPLQAKLLTAIEERSVRRLGSVRSEPADVWFVSATNTDLRAAVSAQHFRSDLYHRLAVLTLDLPPLRDRGSDVLLLAERFLDRACVEYGLSPKRLDAQAQAHLLQYPWPGNVRELVNVIERAVLFADGPVVTVEALGPLQAESTPFFALRPAETAMTRDEAMRRHLLTALEQTEWNISHTAARLGVSRNTVYARMEKLGLRPGAAPEAGPTRSQPAASTPAPAASHLSGELSPPLKPLHETHLPILSSSFVGRERELAEAGGLIGSHRLLTLTGPGGSGKTRLAIQLAAKTSAQFPDGVFWVPLQALRDPALVEPTIRASIGADGDLIAHVASKRLLVLLDNFEQVMAAAPVVSSLLAGTPHAKVLITSRAPLHLDSERRYPVEPLPEPDAATLFIERASAIAPGFHPTDVVGEICRRLDGLPLAIELAAARVALLEPDELLVRLERRLPLLTSRFHDVPARQRTLRATIEWSYELLDSKEQRLFRKLAAFTGSFSLGAAENVCETDLDTLESLVENGLVRRRANGRLGLLDTIREYALERLDESPEAENVRRRHAEFFLAVAGSANLNVGTLETGKPMRHDIAIREQDNVRGALAWAVASGAHALGLAIATSVEQFWIMQDPREGTRWFAHLLDGPAADSVALEIRAHALRAYAACRDIAGDDAAAARLYGQSLALFEQLGDEHGRAVLLHRLGIQAMRRSEPERARELVEASHAIHERNDDRWGLTQTIGTLGALARDTGDADRASELIEKSASLAREVAIPWWESGMLAELAQLSLNAGRLDEAEMLARESLMLADQIPYRGGRVFGVGLFARLAAERGQLERAGRLWGAIESEDIGAPLGGWRRHRQRCEERIREAMSPEFERGYAEGQALRLDDAVSLALAPADLAGT